MLTNPTPTIHQNIKRAMQDMAQEKPVEEKRGLLGPKKPMAQQQNNDDILSSTKRVASYMKFIQEKREEVKNG